MIERVSTGIDGLDIATEGGFPKGSLILVSGNPGAGKTIFATGFIAHGVKALNEPGVYVSFAEDRESLVKNTKRLYGCDPDRCKVPFRILDLPVFREEGVSACLNTIIGEVSSTHAKRLVIDSFTAMAQAFKEPFEARMVLHTLLGKMVRQMGCTTLTVVEGGIGRKSTGFGMEEYVADGVLILKGRMIAGRPVRDLELVKLRSTRLTERNLIFTLDQGFKVFSPLKPGPPKNVRKFEAVKDRTDGYSTGSKELDDLIGGYPKGGVVLLEVDHKIPDWMYHLVGLPTHANFIAQGRSVIVLLGPSADQRSFRQAMTQYGFREAEVNSRLRILESGVLKTRQTSSSVTIIDSSVAEEHLAKCLQLEQRLAKTTGKPVLMGVSLGTFASLYGEDAAERALILASTRIKSRDILCMIVAKCETHEGERRLAGAAQVHLRLADEHGALLLYGIKPRTGLYAVEMDTSKGYPLPKLTPIV